MANLDIPLNTIERIYPTQNDLAFTPYNGVNGSEINFTKNLINRYPKNAVLCNLDGSGNPTSSAGFEVATLTGLNVAVSRGRAYIEGRFLDMLAGTYFTVSLDASKDNYIYLQLNISGVVSVLPPARFITVAVAFNATHSRPSNAVLLAKVITNASTVDEIVDLRPSQMSDSIYIPDSVMTFPPYGSVPAGYTDIGSIDIGDNLFFKTLCGFFYIDSRPFSGDSCIVTVRAIGDSSFVENNQTHNYNISSASNLIRGFVNIPRSLVPFAKLENTYRIVYKIVPTGFTITTKKPVPTMWKLKEWNAYS